MPDHKKQASSNQEDRAAAAVEHTKVVENAERGADRERMEEVQANAPEQISGNLKRSTENQPYSRGEDTEIKRRGRTRGLQPVGGTAPRSPKPKSTSASGPQKTPTAVQEHFHTAKPETQTNTNKYTASQSRKASGEDNTEIPQIRKVTKEGEVDQHVRRITEAKHSQKKTAQANVDSDSEDTVYTEDTNPGPVLKRTITEEEAKKSKGSKSQPKMFTSQTKESTNSNTSHTKESTKESTNPQIKVKKVKKKPKAQAAFVVGKPRQTKELQQSEKDENRQERPERTASSTEEKEPEDEVKHESCCSSPGHSLEIDLVSVDEYQDDAVSSRTHSSNVLSSRTQGSTGISSRTNLSAGVSSRTHSSAAFPTGRESSRRSRRVAGAEACSLEPLSLNKLHSHSTVPVQHPPSNPAKTETSADVKSREGANSLKDAKATALSEKAEHRRLQVERKRKEKEEERKLQLEREEREEREQNMRLELEEEQRQRAEQARLRKLREEEDGQREKEREIEQQKREQAAVERERRRQNEKRRLLEKLQRERREDEERRAVELRRRQQEEEAQRELERRKLQEMEEGERLEYLRRKQEEEEERRKATEERRRKEGEAALQVEEEARLLAQLTAKQRAELEHQLTFNRSLFVEAGGLEQTQDISRPWVFSYFSLLKLLGLAEPPKNLAKDVL
ncbi:uncharacterized protein KIAA2012 homolog isoform X2 [Hoplias malabaricus]|uniref:uncharacterized protein KIAA2012 homolog isoform X2 n=1 Tax=Hoplias malabaricus TaxID=27720 RepID=UPI003461B1E5